MRQIRAIFWSGLGFAFVVGFLLLLSFLTSHAWLPIAYAVGFGCLLSLVPGIKGSRLGTAIGIAMTITVGAVWVRSEGLLTMGGRAVTSEMMAVAWVVALAGPALILAGVWRHQLRNTRSYLPWLAVLLVLAVIVAQSSNAGASAGRMVGFVIRHFHLSRETAETVVVVFRKTIHFSYYGFVGFAAWRGGCDGGLGKNGLLTFAFAAPLLVASFDEIRQSTQVGRTGSIWDVLLDMAGAAAFIAIAAASAKAKSPGSASAKRAQ